MDASIGVEGRNVLLPVDNCAAHPQDVISTQVKLVYYTTNCTDTMPSTRTECA